MSRPHYVNGRVLMRPGGGVRRFADEVATRLTECTVLSPRSAARPWSARVWEQTTLHRLSADGVLLSIGHGGPLRHRRHVLVVHDLLAITMPSSVNPAFAAVQKMQLPRLIERAAMVVTISRAVADEVMSRFDVREDRLLVVPPGISDVFGPGDREQCKLDLGLDPARPVVAALLDPTPRKRSAEVSGVLLQVQHDRPEVQLVVAGAALPGAFARTRRSAVIERPDGCLDLGAASDAQLATMYRAADVFVALSSAEGFGLPVVEAAICGAAVVTTSVPSATEHCVDAVVVVADPAAAAAEVLALLDLPMRRSELALRAAEELGGLRWGATAATLDDVMTQIGSR